MGMLAAAVAILYWGIGLLNGTAAERFYDSIWFCTALGFGTGMLLIKLGRLEGWLQPGWECSELSWLIACGMVLALFSYWCGMRQFGGFDHSIVIDAGWRLLCGQKPYVDFPCTLPVGFYLGAELAFRWFGVFWSSIVKFNVFYFVLTYFWTYAVLRQVFRNRYLSLALAIACESMSLILASYWWYNPPTSMTVTLYVASVASVILKPDNNWLWLSLCLSLLLAALMKPNVSAIAIFGGTAALLISPRTAWRACAASGIAFILWLAVIAIHGSTLFQVIGSYLSVVGFASGRFLADIGGEEKFFACLCALAMLPGLVYAAWPKTWSRQRAALMVLGSSALFASLFGFCENGETKLTDLSLGLMASAILIGETTAESGGPLGVPTLWLSYLILLCTTFTFSSLCDAAIRYRVRGIGLGAFFEYEPDPTPMENPFFKGVRGGHNLRVTVEALTALCSGHNLRNIYFGPRLQWAYAAFHIPSPKGMPIWWHPGVAFPANDESMYTERWIADRFDPLVLMDVHYMNQEFIHDIVDNYVLVGKLPLNPDAAPLAIMTRKP
jgi:hypothetical protein